MPYRYGTIYEAPVLIFHARRHVTHFPAIIPAIAGQYPDAGIANPVGGLSKSISKRSRRAENCYVACATSFVGRRWWQSTHLMHGVGVQ